MILTTPILNVNTATRLAGARFIKLTIYRILFRSLSGDDFENIFREIII